MNKLILLLAVSMMIFSCQNTADNASSDQSNDQAVAVNQPLAFSEPIDFELVCEEQAEPAEETGQAYYKLFLKSALLKEPIFVEKMFGCVQVPKKDYRKLEMISISNAAVNGWHAGGGPLIYGYIEDNNQIVLMKYMQEEEAHDAHAGHDHDHAGHNHDGHDHSHGEKGIEYEEFMRIVVHKDGSFENKTR